MKIMKTREASLKNDIDFYGHLIKNVPVYPDYKGRPSENVSGDVLTRLYELLEENPDKHVINWGLKNEN